MRKYANLTVVGQSRSMRRAPRKLQIVKRHSKKHTYIYSVSYKNGEKLIK